nr:retrovirus-related Pol polyprotein from transposon TNT 1-94 [Tanacetum cinerariifolium]
MAAFNVLETQFQMFITNRDYLNDEYVAMTRSYFIQYTGQAILEFRDILIQHLESVENRTESKEQDTSSRSGNDAHDDDDADIKTIYDEEPMAELQTTAEIDAFAIRQQHTEQPEFNNEGEAVQNAKECHDTCPFLAIFTDNQIPEHSYQSLESKNSFLKKTITQFQKDFSRLEAHCVNLELKYQNQVLNKGKQSQFFKKKSNEAKIKHDIDVIETINIELEHKVAKLLKENEILKKNYKELSDSIKITRAKTTEHTTSLIATNDKFKAQLQEKRDEGGDDEQPSDEEEFLHDEEEPRGEESFDPIPKTPEDTDDEGNGEEDLGLNVGREEGHDKEEEEDELHRDININQRWVIQTIQEVKDSHVTLTPVNPDGQQQSSSVSSQFVTSMLNPTLDAGMESIFKTTSQMDVQTPTSFAGAVFAILGIVYRYMDQRMNEAVQVAVQLQSDKLCEEAQKENDEFLKTIDENMQTIIKEQVKEQVNVQVSKILPRIEQTVNEQLEIKVLTRSSNSSKTSYVVAVDLSKMELKKILIEKMEGNKSIHRSNEQRNLYKALVEAYESDKIILDTLRIKKLMCDGSNTRPLMLDRTDFASWQQRIRLYCRGEDNRVNILKSIDDGPYILGTFRETLAESTEGTPQFGLERPRVYSDLNSVEQDRYNTDIRATNILLQGLPKDIYTLIHHYTDAKDIGSHSCMTSLNASENIRKIQLMTNDMRNIKMTMPKLQLNSKFVNNMLPEWGRFVTAVKLNRGLRESNYDQLFACLKQHEAHAKENKMVLERLAQPIAQPTADPLALLSNVSNAQHGLPSSSTSSITPLTPPCANSTNDLIENLTSMLALLTQSYRTFLPQTNNQLRTSSNLRNQATGGNAAGYGEAQNRAGNVNQGQARTGQARTVKCYNCNDRKHDAIDLKNFLIANDNLIAECLSKEARCLALEAELATLRDKSHQENQRELIKHFSKLEVDHLNLQLKYQNLKDSIGNHPPSPDKDTPNFDFVFVIGKMQASLQEKDNVIRQLKKQISQLQVTNSDTECTVKVRTTDSQLTKVTNPVTNLQAQTDCLRVENDKVKQHYKHLYDSIKITCAKHIKQVTKLTAENVTLKTSVSKAKVQPPALTRTKHAVDVEPIVPRLRNNREAHLDYLRHLKESVETIHDIVEEAKVVRPLDRSIVSAYRYTQHSQELLEYAIDTCPPGSQPRAKQLVHTPLIKKKKVTAIKPFDRLNSNKNKHVVTQKIQKTNVPVPHSTGVKRCLKASGSQPKSNHKTNKISPAKGANKLPVEDLPRTNKSYPRTTNRVDSSSRLKRSEINSNLDSICQTCRTDRPLVFGFRLRKTYDGDRSRLLNFVKKFIETVRFGNDHFGAIMGYGNYVVGESVISRVYYVEGLGHNLFSVGQFCDSDLEVAFRKHSCYVRDTNDVDLIKGSRGTNLYTISVEDMMKSSLICLLSKASKNKSCLWHRRLNHLNFDTINDLARKDLVRGLPRLKFEKDHLCSACQLGKSKKHTHKPKAENTNLEVLNTLHMDLCGPRHVQTINGKKYILVIVDDYFRFTWVKFLRSKDETSDVVIKFITQIQVGLNKIVRYVRTDNITEFVNQTMTAFYDQAVATACYTQNRSLIHTRHHKTPYELVHNKKPDLTFFRVFGTKPQYKMALERLSQSTAKPIADPLALLSRRSN